MTPSTRSRCETQKSGGEIQAHLPSAPQLHPTPESSHEFWWIHSPSQGSVYGVCWEGFPCRHCRKEKALGPGYELCSWCVNDTSASTKQRVLCPPCVNQQGWGVSHWGGKGGTLGMRDKVLLGIGSALFFYISWCSSSQDTQTQACQQKPTLWSLPGA